MQAVRPGHHPRVGCWARYTVPMLWFMLALWAPALADTPTHPVCGAIPGGMYDDVSRVGDSLSITMHRLIRDDATAYFLAVIFTDASGQTLKRWRGDHSKPFWVKQSATWVYRAQVQLPPLAVQAKLYDLHHDRVCTLQIGESITIESVERTGDHANSALPEARPDVAFSDETLQGEAVEVKRGRGARRADRSLDEPPDNLEQRAVLLAKLKQNLPRMSKTQIIEWMGYQGMSPDDPDVIETLGAHWQDSKR